MSETYLNWFGNRVQNKEFLCSCRVTAATWSESHATKAKPSTVGGTDTHLPFHAFGKFRSTASFGKSLKSTEGAMAYDLISPLSESWVAANATALGSANIMPL